MERVEMTQRIKTRLRREVENHREELLYFAAMGMAFTAVYFVGKSRGAVTIDLNLEPVGESTYRRFVAKR